MSYRTFYQNADTYEKPPSVIERADDEVYTNAFNGIVASFRVALESNTPEKLTVRVADICRTGHAFSHEQPVLYLRDTYGYPAVLRALAKAIESPEHVLGELQGD